MQPTASPSIIYFFNDCNLTSFCSEVSYMRLFRNLRFLTGILNELAVHWLVMKSPLLNKDRNSFLDYLMKTGGHFNLFSCLKRLKGFLHFKIIKKALKVWNSVSSYFFMYKRENLSLNKPTMLFNKSPLVMD